MTDHEEVPGGGPVPAVVAGAVPVLLGVLTLWLAGDLRLGTLTDPGPGLWPTAIAVLLVITGVVIAVRRTADTEAFTRGAGVVVTAAASLVLLAVLFERVGFEIPTALVLLLWLRLFGRESWRTTVLVAVLATAAAYLVFITALGVPLPHLIAF